MKTHRIVLTLAAIAFLILPLATACTEPGRHEVAGTLAGGALGAGTGAIIGSQGGHAGRGTAIGAGVGALAGNIIGRGIDEARRANERVDPAPAYGQGTATSSYPAQATAAPPGVPPPPPPPGHYEWDPTAQRWTWRYDRAY
jgi:hypothetical protein